MPNSHATSQWAAQARRPGHDRIVREVPDAMCRR